MVSRHLKCHRVAGGEKTDSGPAEGGAERSFLRELARASMMRLSLHECKAKLRAAKPHPCQMLGTILTPPPGNDKKIKATTSSIESLQILEVPTTQRGRL
jgi:hypothetical protein